jgi:hypothetical protein
MLCYPSGNRDEEVFDDADEVRVDRGAVRHRAFGSGAHTFLGSISHGWRCAFSSKSYSRGWSISSSRGYRDVRLPSSSADRRMCRSAIECIERLNASVSGCRPAGTPSSVTTASGWLGRTLECLPKVEHRALNQWR